MTWYNKLLLVINDFRIYPNLRIVFRAFPPADKYYIVELQRKYPFLDDDYFKFLSLTDGASLWMYELYGSGESEMPSLDILYERWRPNVDELRVFPFAEDPCGNCIAMCNDGKIVTFDYRAKSLEDCVILASTFSELVGDILMGEKFYSVLDGPILDNEENEWLEYLKQQGWISS